MSKPASRSTRALRSSFDLHQMNSSTSGWSTLRMTILAARRVLPPLLMVPAEASAPRMKLTGPEAVPPPFSSSNDERMRDRFTPEPEPPLKMTPSSRYQLRIESIESSTDRMKQALACCGTPFTPMLNHTGELKAAFWVTRRCFSSSPERLGLGVVDEVAAVAAPRGDRVGHPVDDLAQRVLPLRRAQGAPEVLLGDDVGGVQRPGDGELDPELLEGHGAVSVVRDAGVAALPHDLVVGVDARRREVPTDADADPLRCQGHPVLPLVRGLRTRPVAVGQDAGPGRAAVCQPGGCSPCLSTTSCASDPFPAASATSAWSITAL